MTKQEAKQALIEGKNIRHKSWNDVNEYVFLRDGKVFDELEYIIAYIDSYNFHYYKEGWEIYDKTNLILINKEILKEMFNQVMNLGITTRQDQIRGFDNGKSGNEILEEFLKDKL